MNGLDRGTSTTSSSSSPSHSITYSTDEIPILTYTNNNNKNNNLHNQEIHKPLDHCQYEENTFIDWCKESILISRNPLIYQNNNKWIILILSAILLGYLTSAIDLIQVSLNDFKKGICFSSKDSWTLLNPYMTCPMDDWYNWNQIFFSKNINNPLIKFIINFPIYLILAIGFSLIAGYLTLTYNRSSSSYNNNYMIRQSGIPEIKLIISGFNLKIDQYLGFKTLILKSIALIFVVSSGLWLGKEGPLVHISCCVFNIIYEIITKHYSNNQNEAIRRELLTAATATGISVAFNSPIGGVLFVLESMPSYFIPTKIMWNSFVSATVATIILTGFKIFTDGRNFNEQVLFQVNFGNFSWLFIEIIPFITLGILGGIYGHYFIKFNTKFSKLQFRNLIRHRLCNFLQIDYKYGSILEILLIVIITTIINFPFEISKLPLNALLNLLFKSCTKDNDNSTTTTTTSKDFICQDSNVRALFKLLYIMIEGFWLTCYTFGLDLPGGILMPSLVMGAMTGRFLGIITQSIQSKFNWESLATCTADSCVVSPSSYAVIGAASFMTGITKLTMSVVVIMFEMTGAVTYVLPIMGGVMTSKFVSDWLTPNNIYDTWLENNFNKQKPSDESDITTINNQLINQGKGTGLISFQNLTSTIKSKLPNINIASSMIPLLEVKCLCLIPNQEQENFTLNSLNSFINNDSHEGYPMIINYNNPIIVGYIPKSQLLNQLFLSLSNRSIDPNSPISFQITHNQSSIDIPELIQQQLLLLLSQRKQGVQINVQPIQSTLIINEKTPMLLIIEMFEKLHLNNLIIVNSENETLMKGFIDRFILNDLIIDKFEKLVDKLNDYQIIQQFDIEENIGRVEMTEFDYNDNDNDDDDDEVTRIDRKSIELIT
ncbi:voltage-gated chloride channel, putative [Candida dubliniensis CD36]|uniref:Voltage-gated chloride channel, putative n=1 Tax=Candida dubliniensis (strain CD36 / ATCC MYA-646 / CBS 7987 / NCPF 3949 / NRRL Y-17841) TaxID=573826 RepID=B9WJB4_CANDC|nr:voltage-gated chloride channel, putative [Candida dubliniensis CD36]CAX41337.1 voltage-gated chloride channel, putative [Candida dubliniensis CD36]